MKHTLVPLFFSAVFAIQAGAQSTDLYGIIEIGSSGVKPVVVRALKPVDVQGGNENVEQTVESYEVKPVATEEVNPLQEAQADNVAVVVFNVRQQMMDSMAVPAGHIYVVGSSGLASQPSKQVVEKKVNAKLGIIMEFISSDQEAELAFRGVVETLPKNVQQRRFKEVLFLDIGSGNSRGAYVSSTSPLTIKSFTIPWGTKTLAKAVDAKRGKQPFATAVKGFCDDQVLPALREAAQTFPGLQHLRRIYLAGGASWALATMTHPGDPQQFVPLVAGDIDAFEAAASQAVDAVEPEGRKKDDHRLTLEEYATKRLDAFLKNTDQISKKDAVIARTKAMGDIEQVTRKVFSGNQVLAAAAMLESMKEEFGIDKKKMFFSRAALYAWPLGYLVSKISAGNP